MAQMEFEALAAFLANRGFTLREVWKAIGAPDGVIDKHIIHAAAQMFGMTGSAFERAVNAFRDAPPAVVADEVAAHLAAAAAERGEAMHTRMQEPGFEDAMQQAFNASPEELGRAAAAALSRENLDGPTMPTSEPDVVLGPPSEFDTQTIERPLGPTPPEFEPIYDERIDVTLPNDTPGLEVDEVEIIIDDEPAPEPAPEPEVTSVALPVVTIPALPESTKSKTKSKPSSKSSKPKKKT